MGKTFNIFLSTALCLTLVFGLAVTAHAQTGTTSGSAGATTTTTLTPTTGTTGTTDTSGTAGVTTTADPGFPNTGTGGDAPMNLVVLSSSILVLLAGGILLSKRFAH